MISNLKRIGRLTVGHYSVLKIDDTVFQWKYNIPTFLTFFFDDKDFYKEVEVEEYDDEEDSYISDIGYRCTVNKCKKILDSYGFNLPFFIDIYKSFRNELLQSLSEDIYFLAEETSEDKIQRLLSKIYSSNPDEEIYEFIDFLKNFNSSYYDEEAQINNLESYQMFLIGRYFDVPHHVIPVFHLFDEQYFYEYPEVMFLMYIRVLIETVPQDALIELDLSDIIEDEEEVRTIKNDLSNELVEKIQLYNKVFKILLDNEEELWELNNKENCRKLVDELHKCTNNNKKGKLLEELVEVLFASHSQFRVIEKRYSTGDEEIDLIIQNNVEKTFWVSLNSPIFLVECKNWSKPIGTRDLRDFEIKLQNHNNTAKVGLFFSYGGFTRECENE